jgi:hypothetical protein
LKFKSIQFLFSKSWRKGFKSKYKNGFKIG